MSAPQIFLPGETIPSTLLPTAQKRKIGHGLYQDPTSKDYKCSIAGPLEVDYRKKAAYIQTPNARYVPKVGDLVIAQVRGQSQEYFHLYLSSNGQQAILHQLNFEGASKKTRPKLESNDLVYAKVVFVQRNMDIEISCVNPQTGKAEPDGLGPVTGGMVFDVSVGLAEKLLKRQDVSFADELGTKLQGGFEMCIGRNGKVWVDCGENIKAACAVGRCLGEIDGKEMDAKAQKKMVNRIVNELGLT
jgi:exosome complex component RRP40